MNRLEAAMAQSVESSLKRQKERPEIDLNLNLNVRLEANSSGETSTIATSGSNRAKGKSHPEDIAVYDQVEINPEARRLGLTKPIPSSSSKQGNKQSLVGLNLCATPPVPAPVQGGMGKSRNNANRKQSHARQHVATPRNVQGGFFGVDYQPVALKHKQGLGETGKLRLDQEVDLDSELDREVEHQRGDTDIDKAALETVDRFISSSLGDDDDEDFEETKSYDLEDEREIGEDFTVGCKTGAGPKSSTSSSPIHEAQKVRANSAEAKAALSRAQSSRIETQQILRKSMQKSFSYTPLLSLIDIHAPLQRVREEHVERHLDMQQRLNDLKRQQRVITEGKHGSPGNSIDKLVDMAQELEGEEEDGDVRLLVDRSENGATMNGTSPTDATLISAQGGSLFQSSVEHFKTLYDVEQPHSREPAHSSHTKSRGFSQLKKSLNKLRRFGRDSLPQNLRREKAEILYVRQTPFDIGDPTTRKLSQKIYSSLAPNEQKRSTACSMVGDHWLEIGFQRSNPGTDLRGAGMLAILQMVWLVEEDAALKAALLRCNSDADSNKGNHNFPIMAISVNISVQSVNALADGKLDNVCKHYRSAWTAVNTLFRTMWTILCEKQQMHQIELVNFTKQLQQICKDALKRVRREIKR